MKTTASPSKRCQRGSGLLITIVMTAIVLATLAGALAWSSSTTRLNERSNQFARSVAAAEASTETVVAQIKRDYRNGGAKLVMENRDSYQRLVAASSNASTWAGWEFSDARGNPGRTYVDVSSFTNFAEVDSTYAGLKAFISNVRVISNARLTNTIQDVTAGVAQNFQLANIPIFQFAMFSSSYMEISCGQDFKVTGKVHANGTLYSEPDKVLTFASDVTAVGSILFQRHPLDTRTSPAGSVVYQGRKTDHVPSLTMPIGTNNSPLAIREIIQPPPAGEDANSVIGRQRYYNQSDMIVKVSATGISAFTGVPFGQATISTNFTNFISIKTNFYDWRERKVVRPVDIYIDGLNTWSSTNKSLFGGRDVMSIYVLDTRPLTNQLAAVRVLNGLMLPPSGLTIATARPLYVHGHYNQNNPLHLGTTNTSRTYPASLVADAITLLSSNWVDSKSSNLLSTRVACPTTVNAALLTGAVDTTKDNYSGGMENFPRFMETWGSANPLTYNGSLVKMFPSQYATNSWQTATNTYAPPKRDWAFDSNFYDAAKLPPLTPCVQRVMRGGWANLAPNQTTITPLNL